eukprot:6209011-Pleurochrysis_carterae.AAC.1
MNRQQEDSLENSIRWLTLACAAAKSAEAGIERGDSARARTVCDSADGHERLFVHGGVFGGEDLDEELHHLVGEGNDALVELLRHHLEGAAEQPLQLGLRLAVVVGDDLHEEGLLELVANRRQQLLDARLRVLRRVGERRVERLVRRRAQ